MKQHESLDSIMSTAEGMSFRELCEWIKREQDAREDFEAEVAIKYGGNTGYAKALVVDEDRLDEVLRQKNCTHCYCKNYCFNEHVYTNCEKAKKAFLLGQLDEYDSELKKGVDNDSASV